jgi:hypothetical protein
MNKIGSHYQQKKTSKFIKRFHSCMGFFKFGNRGQIYFLLFFCHSITIVAFFKSLNLWKQLSKNEKFGKEKLELFVFETDKFERSEFKYEAGKNRNQKCKKYHFL